MDDKVSKSASSLAMTEKRPQRPGGCVGIFFQLFDWNQRFAKKKLFSKRLLPPARAKQACKKFEDEKLPKPRLIANGSGGGFSNVKKKGTCVDDSEKKREMRAPGLVARLMGLESMPARQQGKSGKAPSSEVGNERGEKFLSNHNGVDNVDLILEKGSARHELRPQKLQKTGQFERRPMTRFGTEALQFKNVLSRSRRSHPKLASPVKSPRSLSGRNVSRLIGAATKILEPGLQSRDRAKCALTYSNTRHHHPKDEVLLEETTALSADLLENSNYCSSTIKSRKGQSSCRNSGNLLDVMDTSPNTENQASVCASSVSAHDGSSFQGSEWGKPIPPISSLNKGEGVLHKGQEYSASLACQAMDDVRSHAELMSNRKPLNRQNQTWWHLTSQQCKPQKDVAPSTGFKPKSHRQNHLSQGRDGVPPRSKLGNLQSNRASLTAADTTNMTKNFVALNRSLSGRIRPRIPAKVDNYKYDSRRKFVNMHDDLLFPVRKRRSMNASRQAENSGFVSSTFSKQREISCNPVTQKDMGHPRHSMNQTSIESRLANLGQSNRMVGIGNKKNDVISFTFSSPVKQKIEIPAETEKKRVHVGSTSTNIPQKNQILAENDLKTFPLRGDTLGALLQQKLKELTCQEEDELTFVGTQPKRTTSMILQELIAALTAERPFPQYDVAVKSDKGNASSYCVHKSKTSSTFQREGASVSFSHTSEHLSPGSVLEACFSNDDYISSSLNGSSAHKLHADYMDCSFYERRPLEPDADLLDSATSVSEGLTSRELVTDLINHVSEVLHSFSLNDTGLEASKHSRTKDVILDAELVFGSARHNLDGTKNFSICCFLLDEMEILASVIWMKFSCLLGFEGTKEGNQLKRFPFDCVVEYLDSIYSQLSKSGFKSWTRLPLWMDTKMLIHEVVEEVRRWTDLAGLIPDELIEREMSHSLGKWTNFEIEEFETGVDIAGDIFQNLVDEIAVDFLACKLIPGSHTVPAKLEFVMAQQMQHHTIDSPTFVDPNEMLLGCTN